ncbi:hypothetical protein F4860DRAFT_478857 [Xylaria cubensis]|nr:hypothetical protein F4860DRAFT_478857 [Xylaria cubensis]
MSAIAGRYCSNCAELRRRLRYGDSPRENFCKKCRVRGQYKRQFCRVCGKTVSEFNSDCEDWSNHNSLSDGSIHTDFGSDLSPAQMSSPVPTVSPVPTPSPIQTPSPFQTPSPAGTMSRSPSPAGSHTSRQSTRATRKQCWCCRLWFDFEEEHSAHIQECNSGCAIHKVCFPWNDNYTHATQESHHLCFVGDCGSRFAKYNANGGFSTQEIEEHIYDEHTKRYTGEAHDGSQGGNCIVS